MVKQASASMKKKQSNVVLTHEVRRDLQKVVSAHTRFANRAKAWETASTREPNAQRRQAALREYRQAREAYWEAKRVFQTEHGFPPPMAEWNTRVSVRQGTRAVDQEYQDRCAYMDAPA